MSKIMVICCWLCSKKARALSRNSGQQVSCFMALYLSSPINPNHVCACCLRTDLELFFQDTQGILCSLAQPLPTWWVPNKFSLMWFDLQVLFPILVMPSNTITFCKLQPKFIPLGFWPPRTPRLFYYLWNKADLQRRAASCLSESSCYGGRT